MFDRIDELELIIDLDIELELIIDLDIELELISNKILGHIIYT